MRITLVISSLAGGGAERAVSEMANWWARDSQDVSIVTWDEGPDGDAYRVESAIKRVHLGVEGHSKSWGRKIANNWHRAMALRSTLRRSAPDVILSFTDSTNVVVLLATRGLGVPVVVAERTDPNANVMLPGVWRILRRMAYRWADHVVAQTRAAADWLDANCAVNAVVIPNLLRDLPAPPESGAREKIVLAVGRLAPEKGLHTLLRSFAEALEQNRDWRLVLAGEGPLRQELMDLAQRIGIGSSVSFEGFIPQPELWMSRAGIFVLSSQFEGFPNALLEAMAMGAPVVSSDCPSGPRELVTEGVNGRLFKVGDIKGLAAILQELMRDEGQRATLGEAAVQVRQMFAPARIMTQWDEVIESARRGRA